MVVVEQPQAEQPESMQRDDQRIMRGAEFDATGIKQPLRVPARQHQLAEALHDDEPEQPSAFSHWQPQQSSEPPDGCSTNCESERNSTTPNPADRQPTP